MTVVLTPRLANTDYSFTVFSPVYALDYRHYITIILLRVFCEIFLADPRLFGRKSMASHLAPEKADPLAAPKVESTTVITITTPPAVPITLVPKSWRGKGE